MVFYKKQYRNIRSAMDNSDGLTVLAFFFHVSSMNVKKNHVFLPIFNLAFNFLYKMFKKSNIW